MNEYCLFKNIFCVSIIRYEFSTKLSRSKALRSFISESPPNHVATRARALQQARVSTKAMSSAAVGSLTPEEGPLTRIDYVDLMVPLQHWVPLEQTGEEDTDGRR